MTPDPGRLPDVADLRLLHPPSIRLAPNARVPMPDYIADLINHPMFQRLRGVRQLGFVERVYPSASHSRFEHSLGVYFRCIHYVHSLWADTNDPTFRDSVGEREIKALLAAALLHDVGQYPYSHVLEDTARGADGKVSESLFDHEHYTRRLLADPNFCQSLSRGSPLAKLIESIGCTVDDVLSVLSGEAIGDILPATVQLLHSIIDGPIDADKLDYLQRDSYHAGVHFGSSIDEHRFYQSLTTCHAGRLQPGEKCQVALTDKGRVPAEQIMLARFHMFTEVYWHRTTRAHEAVFGHALQRIRAHSAGFDKWFQNHVLLPTTSDEWLFTLIQQLLKDTSGAAKMSDVAREMEVCAEMLRSLTWGDGRLVYKRLIGVSAGDDRPLYIAMQRLRDYGKQGTRMSEVAELFTDNLRKYIGVSVDPMELVFDVPPRRSSASSVYIVAIDSPVREKTQRLSDRWGIWSEFESTFSAQTRRIRVFCREEIRRKVLAEAGGHDLVVYQALREAALQAVLNVAAQTDLFAQ